MLEQLLRVAVRASPHPLASALVRGLSGLAYRMRTTPAQRDALTGAQQLRYGEQHNPAWSWGEGPEVILVHGWGGRAAQLAPLARYVSTLGFRAIAIEVSGHGESQVQRVSWGHFIRDIRASVALCGGPVHGFIAHSAGALATMAARVQASRYVCIAGPTHPHPFIAEVERTLGASPRVLRDMERHVAGQFGTSWAKLEACYAYRDAGSDLLLCYDEKDRSVSHRDGDRLHALCAGSQLLKTQGYGHNRILGAAELREAISRFLP